MPQVWRLMSGKITRPGPDGGQKTHKAPYEFMPTEGELKANRWRMQLIESVPDIESVSNTGFEKMKDGDVRKMSIDAAVNFILNMKTNEELDIVLMQETENKPRVRRTVINAIQTRRQQLALPGSSETAFLEISLTENTAGKDN